MKGNFKYSRFNDLEQQIQIESHKINVECIFFKGPADISVREYSKQVFFEWPPYTYRLEFEG